MSPLAPLQDALRGWTEIIAGDPRGGDAFRTDPAAVAVAVATVAVALLLGIAAQSEATGLPSLGQVLAGLVLQGICVGLLCAVIVVSLRLLGTQLPPMRMVVPVLYAYALAVLIGIPLTFVGPSAGQLAFIALAGMIGRAAQVLGGLTAYASIGLAGLSLVVLVAVPVGLYMLLLALP